MGTSSSLVLMCLLEREVSDLVSICPRSKEPPGKQEKQMKRIVFILLLLDRFPPAEEERGHVIRSLHLLQRQAIEFPGLLGVRLAQCLGQSLGNLIPN
ncbi:MAG TPA: hypothetical protein VJB37_02620 [Patescibacteria group bacterium]|nr:hypothetical protein [Patescibacteria group bacterium]